MPGISVWLMRLNITNAAVCVFELTLDEEIRLDGS
jgi:hypothetical protein